MRASWTRDEIILGLDVLFSQDCQGLNKSNPGMIDLSELLNCLPITPKSNRYAAFRNPVGVSSMLRNFWTGLDNPNQKFKVGFLFYTIYNGYKNDLGELHKIANAIRRCVDSSKLLQYGDAVETEGFPEGAILSHVHRNIEARFTDNCLDILAECEVCKIRPKGIYADIGGNSILSKHLLIAPADFDPAVKLSKADFISVCPNCHHALHLIRPWRCRKEELESILIV